MKQPPPASLPPESAPSRPLSAEHATVMGLVFSCPFEMDNPAGCPLHKLRESPPRDRYVWVRSRSVEECLEAIAGHRSCLTRKETARGRSPGGGT